MSGRRYSTSDINYVVDALAKGSTFKAACKSAGVSEGHFREHMEDHPRVKARVNQARARARSKVENALFTSATEPDKQGRRDTKAAEFWLTNQYPEHWRNRRDHTLTGTFEDAATLRRRREELSPEALAENKDVAHREILRQGRKERQLH